MNGTLRVAVAVWGAALVAVALVGCGLVDRPDAAAWDSQVETALTDAAGELATARLVHETAADEELWSPYAVVVLAEAEEAADTLESDLAKVQPPPGRREQADEVLDLLHAATTAVREVREAAVEKDDDDAALVEKLTTLADALARASKSSRSG